VWERINLVNLVTNVLPRGASAVVMQKGRTIGAGGLAAESLELSITKLGQMLWLFCFGVDMPATSACAVNVVVVERFGE